ncbi:assimilatory nitrate reductase catalytic subunit [Peteryoungia aggregata LMG 23059]|uniref:Assimilatory nitrate reductase catalytic subunit n=1 Tax=Peteryoungia aggregata LMG 23059 TaxID=1368425 RepID=A0ABU0G2Y9_9HYPH|nr:nitrate reductase [Peteryoungia aggregata]MDQ0419638.1 assimilatory nitrate reductase catalytic subunit [Peteryoungia aggregata LMG 23059]
MACETKTTCPYCGVGCGVIAAVDDKGKVSVRGDPDHPANYGRLCSKGSALAETLDLEGRALYPEIQGQRAGWDEALDLVASTFQRTIADHGPDSVAFYVSGQLLTEDYYVANKLMKGFIGSANIDTNSRLCMASSVAGHRRAFGADTVPACYEDLELSDLVVLVGSNMAWCHPVLYQRLAAARAARPAMKVVVIDPRRTATSDIADLHLAVHADGDIALFNGLLAHLAETGVIDENYVGRHTSGFGEALLAASHVRMADLSEATGVSGMLLRQFFRLFAQTEKVVTCYSQGVNQSSVGTDKVNAILNCHLATGRIGRRGMGPLSLTGQPNAMGGREVGGLANMLAAHMAIENPEHRERVQRFWKSPVIAGHAGLKAVDMFEAVADGRIKAIWIMSTNPVVSMPDANAVKAALEACPFVVVSDIQKDTDTARLAHVLLPASGWGEKSGTVTNSERRISRQRPFLSVPGEARADWWQLAEVGKRLGFDPGFDYRGPADIYAEHAALSAFENDGERDFDIGAHAEINVEEYDALLPFQWPLRQDGSSTARFFADGGFFTADRKARFVPVTAPAPEEADECHPFTLNTGRIRDHWHTMTRTGKSARLSAHIAEPYCEIHPADADEAGIGEADLVNVEGANGRSIIVRALLTGRQRRGSIFVPMHWTGETAPSARVDTLVSSRVDPISGQPALKMSRASVNRHAAKAHGFLVSASRPVDLPFAYWAIAKAEGGYRLEFAGDPHAEGWETWLRRSLQLEDHHEFSGYIDQRAGDNRLLAFEGDKLQAALFVSSAPVSVSRQWAVDQLKESHPDRSARSMVIAGRPAAGRPDKGAILCSCFSVGINQINTAARGGCRSVEAIGAALSAGTNCGSCRPEIRRILDATQPIAAE